MNNPLLVLRYCFAFIVLNLVLWQLSAQSRNGRIIEQNRALSDFSFIHVEDGVNVFLSPCETFDVKIRADEHLISLLRTNVNEGTLAIFMDGNFQNVKTLEVHISLPKLYGIEAKGGSDVVSTAKFDLQDLKIKLNSGSDAKLEIIAEKVYCKLSGGSDVELSGKIKQLIAEVNSSSELMANALEVNKCNVNADGGSEAFIWVSDELEMKASDASDIYFRGDANILHQQTSGASRLHRQNGP